MSDDVPCPVCNGSSLRSIGLLALGYRRFGRGAADHPEVRFDEAGPQLLLQTPKTPYIGRQVSSPSSPGSALDSHSLKSGFTDPGELGGVEVRDASPDVSQDGRIYHPSHPLDDSAWRRCCCISSPSIISRSGPRYVEPYQANPTGHMTSRSSIPAGHGFPSACGDRRIEQSEPTLRNRGVGPPRSLHPLRPVDRAEIHRAASGGGLFSIFHCPPLPELGRLARTGGGLTLDDSHTALTIRAELPHTTRKLTTFWRW